ncbi:hypothetical protein QTO34_016433 [Cnephaeus nilssonii]|uniref:Alpha-defensin N-terminal domain-containing protein n=1 Tax=Cnephaeus nilssonii TaxID=3371016 RepID=A0AA40LQE1_CNENI|nr:hypothetical protein QTO34_016433 [Eptesicus nilssonii]
MRTLALLATLLFLTLQAKAGTLQETADQVPAQDQLWAEDQDQAGDSDQDVAISLTGEERFARAVESVRFLVIYDKHVNPFTLTWQVLSANLGQEPIAIAQSKNSAISLKKKLGPASLLTPPKPESLAPPPQQPTPQNLTSSLTGSDALNLQDGPSTPLGKVWPQGQGLRGEQGPHRKAEASGP